MKLTRKERALLEYLEKREQTPPLEMTVVANFKSALRELMKRGLAELCDHPTIIIGDGKKASAVRLSDAGRAALKDANTP